MLVTGIYAAGIADFFDNAKEVMKTWGGSLIMFIGVCMMIVAAVKLAKGLMGNAQRQQTSWGMIAVLFLLGGAFMLGGFTLLDKFSSIANDSLEELANGASILLPLIQ